MNQINVTQKSEISSGETLQEVTGYSCDAYEVINIVLPGPTTKKEVVLQGTGSEMSLLQLSVPSGVYGTAPYITYYLLTNSGLQIDLTNMHQYVGRGAIQALMEGVSPTKTEITKLYLTNVHTSPVTVKILVGKDVTP